MPSESIEDSNQTTKQFEDASYEAHKRGYQSYFTEGALGALAASWYRTDTVAAWAQKRVRSTVDPLTECYPNTRWLTVGDGALGMDANYLLSRGQRVLATDIADDLLREAAKRGFIKEYARENAEKLSFVDSSFDFVLCKESYHHFPRPYLALYEMLRVAKTGVVLIEPADMWLDKSSVSALIFRALRLVFTGRRTPKHSYEEVGNYQYTLSIREMEKVALGLNFPVVAYRKFNSFYRKGVEYAPAAGFGKLNVQARVFVALKNVLSTLNLLPWGLITIVIFKTSPSYDILEQLSQGGFSVNQLPRNPYIRN